MKGFMSDRIAGQEIPLHQISNAVSAWDPYADADVDVDVDVGVGVDAESSASASDKMQMNMKMKMQRPLSLLFTGSDGVGKQELAMQVANMLLHHHGCTRERSHV